MFLSPRFTAYRSLCNLKTPLQQKFPLVSGTLGVAVTYCCHGEEENKMMAIAQKCSLALSPLPGKRRKAVRMLVPLWAHNTIVFALPTHLEAYLQPRRFLNCKSAAEFFFRKSVIITKFLLYFLFSCKTAVQILLYLTMTVAWAHIAVWPGTRDSLRV